MQIYRVRLSVPCTCLFFLKLSIYFKILNPVTSSPSTVQLNPITTPQPLDERPIEERTQTFVQPDNERPTSSAIPTGTVDLHILQPTRPTPASHVGPYSCRHEGKLYRDQETWRSGPCTNCTCVNRVADCKTDEECVRGTRPTRQPQEGYDTAAVPGTINNKNWK